MRKNIFLLTTTLCLAFSLNAYSQEDSYTRAKRCLERGNNVAAIPLLETAAKDGFGEAAYILGQMYYDDRTADVKQDYVKARVNFNKAIELGFDKGYTQLGYIYYSGWGIDSDKKKAVEYLEKGVAQGDKNANFLLGQLYFYGDGVEQDYKQAYKLLRATVDERYLSSMDAMNVYSANILGICNEHAYGTRRNLFKALQYYNKSLPEALQRGAMLMDRRQMEASYDCPEGDGNIGDKTEYIEKAIQRGLKDPMAYYYYAVWRANKIPLEERAMADERVASTIQYAANNGIGIAQKTLGDWYSKGWFVSKNLLKAKEYYEKAKANNYDKDELPRIESDRAYRNNKGIYRKGDIVGNDSTGRFIVVNIDSLGKPTRVMSTKEYKIKSPNQFYLLLNERYNSQWLFPLKQEMDVIYKYYDTLNAMLATLNEAQIKTDRRYIYAGKNNQDEWHLHEIIHRIKLSTGETSEKKSYNPNGLLFRPVADVVNGCLPQYPEYMLYNERLMKSDNWQQMESDASFRNSQGVYFPGDIYLYEPEQKPYVVLAVDLMYHPVRLMSIEASGGRHLATREDVVTLYQCIKNTNENLRSANLPILPSFERYAFFKDKYPYTVINMSNGKFESNPTQEDLRYQVYDLKDGKIVK